ncbi:MAG: hypothetical protein ACJ761_01335 [Chloroflexota bacterium]
MSPFDPTAPLPGPPDPWAATDVPSPRDGPPYHMTDMIAAEPHVTRRTLARLAAPDGPAARLAGWVRETADAGASIILTGCGTSEHGALGGAEILRDALRVAGSAHPGPTVEQAFELALRPPGGGLVIGISHEGASAATNAALAAARDAGARTAIVTVTDRSPGAQLVDLVVTTDELDQGWCHTIGYLAPLLAATAMAAALTNRSIDPEDAARLVAGGLDEPAAEGMAARLGRVEELIVIASGVDRAAGRELVLKVEEAAWLPSAYRDLETFLHGHLPATGSSTGLVIVLAERERRPERVRRARQALAAATTVGVKAAAILDVELDPEIEPELTPAGRLLVPAAPSLPRAVAALLGSVIPLQLLTERIARVRGTNPDPIRRDDPRYLAAGDAAEREASSDLRTAPGSPRP